MCNEIYHLAGIIAFALVVCSCGIIGIGIGLYFLILRDPITDLSETWTGGASR